MSDVSVTPYVPRLLEWVTATEAAHELGVQRQWMNLLIKDGKFKSLHVLGERPIYVIKREELDRFKVDFAGRPHKRTKDAESESSITKEPSDG